MLQFEAAASKQTFAKFVEHFLECQNGLWAASNILLSNMSGVCRASMKIMIPTTMLLISTTEEWRTTHTGAVIGLLELSGLENTHSSLKLDEKKRETEAHLRERYQGFSRHDLLSLPVMSAYEQYYKRFNKTYHVQLQVESIVLKGKGLPLVSPLVDSNFVAEVETLVLTAGHDVAKLRGSISIDVSREGDQITQMSGAIKAIRGGDMIMRDAGGVCCSILYGQDNRSPISTETACALYVAYAPVGVPTEAVEAQLGKIEEYVRLFSPMAIVEQHRLLSA
jgi:DNA/RNA-binding domain of Phe-tRNA-synthetase-like protein